MDIALITNVAVNAVIGAALLILWLRNPAQKFTAALALSCFAQLVASASYVAVRSTDPLIATVGVVLVSLASSAYLSLMISGVRYLSGYQDGLGRVFALLVGISAMNLISVHVVSPLVAQGIFAASLTAVGVLSLYWLWKIEPDIFGPRRFVGIFVILLGLNQFTYVILGDAGVAQQASVGTVLRIALALTVFGSAVQLITDEARHLQHRFERLSEVSAQGIVILQNDAVVYANPASLTIYGIKIPQKLTLSELDSSVPKGELQEVTNRILRIRSGLSDVATFEALRFKVSGEPIWLRFQYFRSEWDGDPAIQILISDETERHEAARALELKSQQDELTGLPNRTVLLSLLDQRCVSAGAGQFSVILLDIDRFKAFNESHGYVLGDSVLKALATALRTVVEARHSVMRLGEDEFAIVSAVDCAHDEAQGIAEQISVLLSRSLAAANGEYFLDCSMGISLFPDDATDPNSLLRAADGALNSAKNAPGTSYRFSRPGSMSNGVAFEQEQALRAGFTRAEFKLFYQPKVDSHTGELKSFEALARWDRPGYGMVSPLEFIAVAERIGMIGVLGTEFLKQACTQITLWRARHGYCVPVAVNVSPLQMLDVNFPNVVEGILKEHGVPPEFLTLEITESSAVQNLESTIQQVRQLQRMGVFVAMDDFGTGFSSLNMLRTLPLHTIKIDKGLIDPLPQADAVEVVRAICTLAAALKLHVVAEGVETQEQAIAARDAGCGELQGYLFSRPLVASDADAWLHTKNLSVIKG
jgi:diguanylate cyclase (GGDEF)-like protein/PAS domain S-box-containing protein